MYDDMKELVGRKVEKIFMNMDYLKFETDKGSLLYSVYGDCCSSSYFYDFYGVKNLLKNGVVTEIKSVELDTSKIQTSEWEWGDCIQCYGFQITTESPEFGEMTSVFSFRNSSNGYYGGNLVFNEGLDLEVSPEITDDVIEVK